MYVNVHCIWPNYSDLSEVTEINFEIDDLACLAVIPDFVAMEKNFWGPEQFFPPPCPRHIFEPLVPQKPTKLLGAPKVFFRDPVPVTYSNPRSHKSRQNFPGPQKFFSTMLSPSHIRTLGPTKADKTFRGPKSFFP